MGKHFADLIQKISDKQDARFEKHRE